MAKKSLRALAKERGVHFGAAVGEAPLREDALYREVLAREFNMAVCENAMKFGPLRPARDQFDFGAADEIVAFAERHDMAVRGHALLWHRMLPAWFEQGGFGYDEAVDVVRGHIHTVTRRYRGRVAAWDVVNEAIEENGSWRDSVFLRTFGPDYLTMAFHWAHEGDPEARLFYNDYGAEEINKKSDSIYILLCELLKQGVPVHGVGLQMHANVWNPPEKRSLAENIRRLNALGLEVQITEMDVQIRKPVRRKHLKIQAAIYRDVLETCLEADNCTAFLTWGVLDKYSWIPYTFPDMDAPLLFDDHGRPKPAYEAARKTLTPKKDRPRWRRLFS